MSQGMSMLPNTDDDAGIADVVGLVRPVRSLIEEKFLAMGQSLEQSASILNDLTTTFQALLAELESDALKKATRDISATGPTLSTLSGAFGEERQGLQELTGVAESIDTSVTRMRKAVHAAGVLGINARIEATQIGSSQEDFKVFAEEIHRALSLAQDNLAELDTEVVDVLGHLGQANRGEQAFDMRHGETLRLVPARLSSSIDTLSERHDRAAAAAGAVAERSQQIARRVGEAVMALQIGDITRQRIEHVEEAIALMTEIAECRNADAETWQRTGEPGRRRLLALGCRLQAEQLKDTAIEFDREVARIFESLDELGRSAADIIRLGQEAYGGSGLGHGNFLLELEDGLDQARALVEGLRDARLDTDQLVDAVREAATRLLAQIDRIRSLEVDIRIVGLNTTFRCARQIGSRSASSRRNCAAAPRSPPRKPTTLW